MTNATFHGIFSDSPESKISEMKDRLAKSLNDAKGILVFGAGNNGRRIAGILRSQAYPLLGFIDEVVENQGKVIGNLPVYSPDEAAQRHGSEILIIVSIFNPSHSFLKTREKLDAYDWRSLSIFHLCLLHPDEFLPFYFAGASDAMLSNQRSYEALYHSLTDDYSRKELVAHLHFRLFGDFDALLEPIGLNFAHLQDKLAGNVAFVDGGAFDGDSIQAFLNLVHDRFSRIVAYEPDSRNFKKLSAFCQSLPPSTRDRIEIANKGVWAEGGMLGFNETSTPGSSLHPDSANKVQVVALDEDLQLESSAFVKLDVEGAEMEALHGAKNLIQRGEAIFCVAVYHKPNDLWEIPQLISQYNRNYRFGLRSHGCDGADLMLYAFPA